MTANLFKLEGVRVDSLNDFIEREVDNEFKNILYYPDCFKSKGREPIVMNESKFSEVSFKDTDFENVRFIDCVFEKCLFIGASITNCEFTNCTFIDTNTAKLKIKGCLLDPVMFDGNFDLVDDSNIAIDLYHSLYKNSSETHQPEYAVESLYRMKVAESKQLDSKSRRKQINRKEYLKEKLKHWMHDFVSGYGLRVGKVFRFLLIVISIFTLLNYSLKSFIFNEAESLSLVDAFYFTCVTITTLGYGDIAPTSQIGRFLIVIQVLVGFVVISLFLSATAKRALRAG